MPEKAGKMIFGYNKPSCISFQMSNVREADGTLPFSKWRTVRTQNKELVTVLKNHQKMIHHFDQNS